MICEGGMCTCDHTATSIGLAVMSVWAYGTGKMGFINRGKDFNLQCLARAIADGSEARRSVWKAYSHRDLPPQLGSG